MSLCISSLAQEKTKGPNVFVSPRVTLGYTFGSGLNYGFDLFVGLYQFKEINFGTNFTWYMVNTPDGHHRIKGISLVGDYKYLNVKLGAGAVSRRWGLRNVNKASAPGIMIDVSATGDPYKAPWIGVKSFLFKRDRWLLYDKPSYISVYGYFRSQDIEIYKDEAINTGQ